MVKIIKDFSKLNDKSAITIFFAFSIIEIIYIGLDVTQYLVYNVSWYFNGDYSQMYPENIALKFHTSLKLLDSMVFYLRPFFQLPVLFIISSIIIKAFIVFFIYKISLYFVSEKALAFYIAIFYIVSQYTHGVNCNGMWGSPLFFRASISVFFTLLGIYSIIKNRFFWLSFFLFSLSIQLHPAYGLTALMYFFAGYLFYIIVSDRNQIKKVFFLLLIIFANAFFLFILSKDTIGTPPVNVSVGDWYRYLYQGNPDDVVMLWTFQKYGYILLPLILFAFCVSLKNTQKTKIDYFFFGTVFIWVFFMVVELLHWNNIFFGILSEYFIVLEFRRGLWVLTFFATIIAFREMYKLVSLRNILINKKLLFILLLSLSIYIKPTALNMILLAIFLMILVSNVYVKMFSLLAIGYILSLFVAGKYIPILSMNNTILYTMYTLLCSFGGLFILRKIRRIELNVVVMLPFCFFLGTAFMYGVYKKNFVETYSIVANNGLFQYPAHEKLIIDYYRYDKSKKFNIEMIQAIQKENKDHRLILMPKAEQTISDMYIYKAQFYGDLLIQPNFSRKMFCYMVHYLNEMGIVNYGDVSELIYDSKGSLYGNIMDKNYHKLTHEKLLYLKEKYGLGIFIAMKEYDMLRLIYKDHKYFVYAL